jgi:ATP-dependent Clp protease adaptor protein ClpS
MTTEVETETRVKVKVPSLYRVILKNDNYTPMEFVIEILISLFGKSYEEAMALTVEIHEKGKGVAGIYTREVAEQKVIDTLTVAKHQGHPLQASLEEA